MGHPRTERVRRAPGPTSTKAEAVPRGGALRRLLLGRDSDARIQRAADRAPVCDLRESLPLLHRTAIQLVQRSMLWLTARKARASPVVRSDVVPSIKQTLVGAPPKLLVLAAPRALAEAESEKDSPFFRMRRVPDSNPTLAVHC